MEKAHQDRGAEVIRRGRQIHGRRRKWQANCRARDGFTLVEQMLPWRAWPSLVEGKDQEMWNFSHATSY